MLIVWQQQQPSIVCCKKEEIGYNTVTEDGGFSSLVFFFFSSTPLQPQFVQSLTLPTVIVKPVGRKAQWWIKKKRVALVHPLLGRKEKRRWQRITSNERLCWSFFLKGWRGVAISQQKVFTPLPLCSKIILLFMLIPNQWHS